MILENVFFNLVGGFLDLVCRYRPFVTGLLQPGDDFVSVVRNTRTVFLYDVELEAVPDLFVSREALGADQTLSSPSDNPPAFAGARVYHLVPVFFTEWASHRLIQKNTLYFDL